MTLTANCSACSVNVMSTMPRAIADLALARAVEERHQEANRDFAKAMRDLAVLADRLEHGRPLSSNELGNAARALFDIAAKVEGADSINRARMDVMMAFNDQPA